MACYRASVNEAYDGNGVLQHVYPPPPTYSQSCPVNLDYDTLPPDYPMRTTAFGPTSLKHIYRSPEPVPLGQKPNGRYYPIQKMKIPKDSMYGVDTSTYGVAGNEKYRVNYGSKFYPYQHRHPREVSEYSNTFLPVPNQFEWTIHHTVSDGAWGK